MNRIFGLLVLFCVGLFLTACSTAPKIERMEPDTTVDISGKWNDTDSRLVAEEMIEDCLNRPWVEKFEQRHQQRTPAVIVGTVKNRSHEHINVQTFVKELERALINSGRVQFVASKDERGQIRDERMDMAQHASDETMKPPGEEYGADYMLIGTINTIRDQYKGRAVMFYQVDLELVSLEDNRKAWIGEKKIKKLIEKPSAKW